MIEYFKSGKGKIIIVSIIVFIAIFMVQRLIISLSFYQTGDTFWNWEMFDAWSSSSNWVLTGPTELYLISFFSCILGSFVLFTLTYLNSLKKLILSECICIGAIFPTIMVLLTNPGPSCFCILALFYTYKNEVALMLFFSAQAGIIVGIFIYFISLKIYKLYKNKKQKGIAE
jgi:hypothetical protein